MARKKSIKKEIKKNEKKKTSKSKTQTKQVKEPASEDVIAIDWKIPVAFLAGVLVTALFFYVQGGLQAPAVNDNLSTAVADAHVTLYVLNDASCTLCDASWIEPRVKLDFSDVSVNYVDVSSTQGQSFLNSLSINSLPAAFFASDIEEAGNYSMYVEYNWMVPVGNYYLLNIQGVKDLTRTPTATPTVDLFVMSECPYGVPAQQAMIDAKNTIPDFDLNIHFIGNVYTQTEWDALSSDYQSYYQNYGMCEQRSNGKYYCSLHGPEEVDNDIAQLCAMNYYENWTDFITAHINNNFNLTLASQEAGYDVSLMQNCVDSETGWDLYEADIAVAEERGVGASPTYIFDNVITGSSGIMTNGPAGLLCTLHPSLSGCENVDSIQVAQATGSC
ncbi:MAG: hypothetical protein JW791_02910 [Nanoarchaeota archaeon]|nr:hypothetical protein [Nanoarchaeota archaeon]